MLRLAGLPFCVFAILVAGCAVRAEPGLADDETRRQTDLAEHRATAARGPVAEVEPEPACPDGTVEWPRAVGVTSCATPCVVDNDCVGYPTGDERCRLMDGTGEPTFVDAELAAELVEAKKAEEEALGLELDEADMEESEDGVTEQGITARKAAEDTDEGPVIVYPDCDENCEPLEVAAPKVVAIPRLCDELWDVDAVMIAPDEAQKDAARRASEID